MDILFYLCIAFKEKGKPICLGLVFRLKLKRIIMMEIKKILVMSLVAIVAMSFSVPSKAQLIVKKQGTIQEQIKNSPLFYEEELDPIIAEMLDYASKFKGVRYRTGAMGPNRFDCSGFTSYVFAHFGYKLDRTSSQQAQSGKVVAKNELQPGDLVFFNGRRAGGSRVGHVGIVTKADNENETFEFIHASCSQGVVVSKSTEAYYDRRYVKACRMIEELEPEIFGADYMFDVRMLETVDTIQWIK